MERQNVRPVIVLVVLVMGYVFFPDLGPTHQFEPSGKKSAGYVAVGVGVVCCHDGRMGATQIFGIADPTRAPDEADTGPAPIVRDDAGPSCPTRWHLGADRLR